MDKSKLLYVDDEQVNLQLFKFNFQKQFDIILVNSAVEALNAIQQNDIRVIITDLKMPQMNGVELVNKIKEQYPEKCCIMLSAYHLQEALNMGLDENSISAYITKPWKRETILNAINKALEE